MTHASCPTAVINASADTVWRLLTEPAGWGDFFDVRITRVVPAGPAAVGQRIYGESGPRLLHLKLEFECVAIDADHYRLMLNVRLPFGITVREDLNCVPLQRNQCRVNYRCEFGFPTGFGVARWRALRCTANSTSARSTRCRASRARPNGAISQPILWSWPR